MFFLQDNFDKGYVSRGLLLGLDFRLTVILSSGHKKLGFLLVYGLGMHASAVVATLHFVIQLQAPETDVLRVSDRHLSIKVPTRFEA